MYDRSVLDFLYKDKVQFSQGLTDDIVTQFNMDLKGICSDSQYTFIDHRVVLTLPKLVKRLPASNFKMPSDPFILEYKMNIETDLSIAYICSNKHKESLLLNNSKINDIDDEDLLLAARLLGKQDGIWYTLPSSIVLYINKYGVATWEIWTDDIPNSDILKKDHMETIIGVLDWVFNLLNADKPKLRLISPKIYDPYDNVSIKTWKLKNCSILRYMKKCKPSTYAGIGVIDRLF